MSDGNYESLVTADDVVALCPHVSEDVATAVAEAMVGCFPEYGLTTALRVCAFVSQAAHESNGFHLAPENLSYSAVRIRQVFPYVSTSEAQRLKRNPKGLAERVYGLGNPRHAHDLGNVSKGDGWKYRGRGVFQVTGRANYTRYGNALGVDLVGDPDLLNDPKVSMRVACEYWKDHNLNALADVGDILHVTKKINGGTNGLEDRRRYYKVALGIWTDARVEGHGEVAQAFVRPGTTQIAAVQDRLFQLGYLRNLTEREKGKYGKLTRTAILSYQDEHGTLKGWAHPGEIDDALMVSIDDAGDRRFEESRENATPSSVAAGGDQAAAAIQTAKKVVALAGGGTVAAAPIASAVLPSSTPDAPTTGVLDHVTGYVDQAKDAADKAAHLREVGQSFWGMLGEDLQHAVVHFWYFGAVGAALVGFGVLFSYLHKAGQARAAETQDGN